MGVPAGVYEPSGERCRSGSQSDCMLETCVSCRAICFTFCFHVVDGVGNDFVRVVRRSLPRQQDGRAGHGVGVDVSGCTGPILRHHHDEARRGQDRALLVLCLALVNRVVLWDNLVYHQFTAKNLKTTIEKQVKIFIYLSYFIL